MLFIDYCLKIHVLYKYQPLIIHFILALNWVLLEDFQSLVIIKRKVKYNKKYCDCTKIDIIKETLMKYKKQVIN